MPLPSPILVLTNQLATGGAEQYVVAVTRALADAGAEVALAATPGELTDRLDPRVRYHPVALTDVRLGLPLAALRVRRIVRRLRPRAVLANSLVTALVARLAAPRLPVVAVAHGYAPRSYPRVAPLLRAAHRVVAVSDDVARHLRDGGLDPGRLRVVPNGVDVARFPPLEPDARAAARRALGAGPDDVAVLAVGRLAREKAHVHVPAVAAALRRAAPRIVFAVAGEGPERPAVEAVIAAAGVADRVRLLGNRADVPDLLRAADVYLSTSDQEGMSLATLEAMAAGLPVVCTDVGGMRALVDDANGARLPAGDVLGLARAVDELAADPARRRRLGAASRARVETSFSFDATVRGLAAVLAEVVPA